MKRMVREADRKRIEGEILKTLDRLIGG